ncbi:MAG: electron transfer flavoprotein subunit alpha/FixB family protein [Deltaproteobacteria bacterium]|nr:electron transfer flavoprotein subunit alpha/FixB family protein [Deltaproteobacteria bacterium]
MIGVLLNFDSNNHLTKNSYRVLEVASRLSTIYKKDVMGLFYQDASKDSRTATVPGIIKRLIEIRTPSSYEAKVNALAKLFKELNLQIFVAEHNTFSKEIIPQVAGKLGLPMITDIVGFTQDGGFKKYLYSGSILSELKLLSDTFFLTVRANVFDETKQPLVELQCEMFEFLDGRDKIIELRANSSERPDLTTASVVVTGGRALGSREAFENLIFPLADCLKAAIGATRAAVDNGYAPNDWQVGQTGKVVAPSVYLAIGVSGAIQHIAGIKDSKFIAVINKDPSAPIFEHADLFLVADLFKAVPEITEKLRNKNY